MKPLLACLLAVSAWAAGTPVANPEGKAKADSVRSLEVILSSEFKAGNKVLRLENRRLADSLVRAADRQSFIAGMRDTAIARGFDGQTEFSAYWKRVEAEHGLPALKDQLAAHDVDKTRIPKAYFFDSTVVVFPGWIVLRRVGD